MLIRAKALEGYNLSGRDGALGTVQEFFFDDQHWAIRYLVAETGNWLLGRQVLISPYALGAIVPDTRHVMIALTKKQIEDSPSLNTDKPVSRQFERAYYTYYGWPAYWGGPYMWGSNPYILRPTMADEREIQKEATQPEKPLDPHLRSTHDMTGHHVQAADGEVGHVEDFIIDDDTWAIRYLIIDTHNWWPGKRVLVAPQWIDRVSWAESKVFTKLNRASIKQSPEYKGDMLLNRTYETALHQHYNRQGYWVDELAAKELVR